MPVSLFSWPVLCTAANDSSGDDTSYGDDTPSRQTSSKELIVRQDLNRRLHFLRFISEEFKQSPCERLKSTRLGFLSPSLRRQNEKHKD